MLHDMGDAGRVFGRRAEARAEDLVLVVIFHRDQFSAGLVMAEDTHVDVQFRDIGLTRKGEAVGGYHGDSSQVKGAEARTNGTTVDWLERFGD